MWLNDLTSLLLPKAQQEIINAWEWYEDKQPGLGDRFKEELARKIRSILENPLKYPLKGIVSTMRFLRL